MKDAASTMHIKMRPDNPPTMTMGSTFILSQFGHLVKRLAWVPRNPGDSGAGKAVFVATLGTLKESVC